MANDTILSRSATLTIATDDVSSKLLVQQQGSYDTSFAVPPNNMDMRDLSSVQLTQEMGVGWNAGNSLEAIGGETDWNNPLITQQLIDAVQSAGFNAIRIPVAWSKFSDANNFIIEESWKERVEEVVNYVLGNGMYAIKTFTGMAAGCNRHTMIRTTSTTGWRLCGNRLPPISGITMITCFLQEPMKLQ